MPNSTPFSLLVLIILISLFWHWRRLKSAKPRLLCAAVAGLFLMSWPPVSWVAAQTLEGWYVATAFPQGDAEAIVVLSGAVYPATRERPRAIIGYSTLERCEHAAWLYKNWRALPVLACGGLATRQKPPASVMMRETLEQQGVPPSMIWTEQRSRDTYESAVYGAEMLRGKNIKTIALVTDAYHMLRAEKCFRRQGVTVVAAPCGFSGGFGFRLGNLLPKSGSLMGNEEILHEWLGLGWYKLRGRI